MCKRVVGTFPNDQIKRYGQEKLLVDTTHYDDFYGGRL
jgi:hypothetical protein